MLTNVIEGDPWLPVQWISAFLGYILNFLFDVVYSLTANNSMGLAIILLTIVARTLMLPMAFSQQKSMVAMRMLQPQMEKIKAKYAGTKDPEQQRKMNVEIQGLYSKNKVNPFSGCLPIFITLPIFFALSSLMRNSYLYVNELGRIYEGISTILVNDMDSFFDFLMPIIKPKAPNMRIDLDSVETLSKALNRFTPAEWTKMLSEVKKISQESYQSLMTLFTQKQQIENFLGIDLIAATGWNLPGVIIPVLTGLTTFLSTWVLNKQQATNSTDPTMKTQQTMMLVVMPIMMTYMTTGLACGVGIYWIASSVYQTVQQILLNKYYTRDGAVVLPGAEEKPPKEIITLDKSINKKKGEK
jgi:YidC/Oxa1 family membrane protein insertase